MSAIAAVTQNIKAELEQLDQEIGALKAAGWVPFPAPFVLDSSHAGGKIYYRRRDRGQNGRPGKSQQISADAYSELRSELERGRAIARLQRRRERLERLVERAAVEI